MDKELLDRENIITLLEDNCFVEAGAGAGKTTILVSRILNQIKSGKLKVEEIVAITFTNKAAEELKGRIGDRIRKEFKKTSKSSEEYLRLKEALYNYDRMHISTIHSFCFKLLTEQTFLAKMRLDMSMLEEEDNNVEITSFFMNWFKNQSYDTVEYIKKNIDYWDYVELIKCTFLEICDLPDDTNIMYDVELLKNDLQHYLDLADGYKLRFINAIVEAYNEYQSAIGTGIYYKDIDEMFDENVFMASFKSVYDKNSIQFLKEVYKDKFTLFKTDKSKGLSKKEDTEGLLQDVYSRLKDYDGNQLFEEYMTYQISLIINFLLPLVDIYRKNRSNRFVSNDVLLQKTKNLVCDNELARMFFSNKYKCIYVDEFQDTDHVQAELIWAICCDAEWNLKDGALFVVGDPKQSIYKFRGADLPVFFDIKKRMAELNNCKLYSLNYNFRTSIDAIDWINKNNSDYIVDYSCMETRVERNEFERDKKYLSGVYCFDKPCSATRDYNNIADASRLADTIQGLIDNEIYIWDKSLGNYRRIQYKDFLVLCYSQNNMEIYMKEFIKQSIPVQIAGKIDLFTVEEIKRFVRLYNFLANPKHKRAREGALQTVLHDVVTENNEETAEKRLQSLFEATKNLEGDELAYYLSRHLEYVLKWDATIDKNSLIRVQGQIQQMIENVISERTNNRQDIYLGFEKYVSEMVDRELALLENSDSIRFMNLHKAKGLEGRIVCVVKRSENIGTRECSYQEKTEDNAYDYYLAIDQPSKAIIKPVYKVYGSNEAIKKKAMESEKNEGKRLEYVECTRCMEALIVFDAMLPAPAQRAFKLYDFGDVKNINNEFPEIFTQKESSEKENPNEFDCKMWDYRPENQYLVNQKFKISPSSLEKNTTSEKITAISMKRPSGRIYGTVLHRALELLINKCLKDCLDNKTVAFCVEKSLLENRELLEKEFEERVEKEIVQYREYLLKAVEKVSKDDIYLSKLKRAKKVYTEYPFKISVNRENDLDIIKSISSKLSVKKSDGLLPYENEDLVISGKADVLVLNDDGTITIYDYKSDIVEGLLPEEVDVSIENAYSGQMDLYKRVISKIFETSIDKIKGEFYLIN